MSNLREVHAHTSKRGPGDSNAQISVGQIVIVKDEHLPRGLWKLGTVQKVMKGRDGLIRVQVVKVASRERQHFIQLLYPLEIHCGSTAATPSQAPLDPKSCEPSPADDVTEQVRPKRAASKKADGDSGLPNWKKVIECQLGLVTGNVCYDYVIVIRTVLI